MSKYVLHNTVAPGDNNAGSKAGRDAISIAEGLGYRFIPLYQLSGIHTSVRNVLEGYLRARRLCGSLQPDDIVFLQYPINRQLMKRVCGMLKRKRVRIIMLIHDIDYLRDVPYGQEGVEGMKRLELSLLREADVLICHNPSMIEELRREDLEVQFVSLDLFDYLYDGPDARNTHDDTVIVAGNLAPKKSGYLYKLKEGGFRLALYGSNLEVLDSTSARYRGSFPPDELISHLEGAYGLVWDGDEVSTCSGAYGKYLRVNDPHKVSLYLAAGLPVIVWKESALYPFITENGLGFGVDSLLELGELLRNEKPPRDEDIAAAREKVRSGWFLIRALKRAEELVSHG